MHRRCLSSGVIVIEVVSVRGGIKWAQNTRDIEEYSQRRHSTVPTYSISCKCNHNLIRSGGALLQHDDWVISFFLQTSIKAAIDTNKMNSLNIFCMVSVLALFILIWRIEWTFRIGKRVRRSKKNHFLILLWCWIITPSNQIMLFFHPDLK